MGRDKYPTQSLGGLHGKIKESRVLMVGAGGIGCELLKNLVLTGFGEIHIVDLDTIDLSNLNRQFLFRQEHLKKSKALVAKDSASKFNPHVKLEAHHANIKDSKFTVDWFKGFDLVFNALDNMDARRHVNKMCLMSDISLIESGTVGYFGNVQVIKKGVTECYDCVEKEAPKSFPVCTIRSTPSQPIHCIVWAKSYLFNEIFGTSEDEAPELDSKADADNQEELENLQRETLELKRIRESMGSDDFAKLVFDKVYRVDIDRLRSVEDAWKTRKPPEILDFDKLKEAAKDVDQSILLKDQKVWTLEENFTVFSQALKRLSDRLVKLRSVANGDAPPVLSFDKDDRDILDFVASGANLRSHVFDIPTTSEFQIKQMAGNIIPAIATTNAIVSSICVLQGFQVLRGAFDKARRIYLAEGAERCRKFLNSDPIPRLPPNPACPTCSKRMAQLRVDIERATLGDLVDGILKGKLGYKEEFSVMSDAGVLYDPDMEDNLPKKLSELGIKGHDFLTIHDDEDESPHVEVSFYIAAKSTPPSHQTAIEMPVDFTVPTKPPPTEPNLSDHLPFHPSPNGDQANGHVEATNGATRTKRKADDAELGDDADQANKKGKVFESPSMKNAIVVEDDGVISID